MVDDDPLSVDPMRLGDIEVIGTVFEGRWFPVSDASRANRRQAVDALRCSPATVASDAHADHGGCACAVVHHVTRAIDAAARAA